MISIERLNNTINEEDLEDVESLLQKINSAARDYRSEYINYVRNTEKYNKYSIYELSNTIYLLSILTN